MSAKDGGKSARALPSIDALLADLGHPRVGTRVRAVRALIRQPDARALSPLIEALMDDDGRVREEAVRALGKLGAMAVQPLRELMRNGDPRAYGRALEAVALTGAPEAIPVLLEAMREPKPELEPEYFPMEEVSSALARTAIAMVLPLVQLLQRPQGSLCGQVAELLVKFAAVHPSPKLRAALPSLRRLLVDRKQRPADRELVRSAILAIEGATAGMQNLPLAAQAPQDDCASLPIPSEIPSR
jgi:hypothetical protein